MDSNYILYIGNDEETISELSLIESNKLVTFKNALMGYNFLNKEDNLPNAIISEIELPGMNGYKFKKEINNRKSLKNIPFLLLTENFIKDLLYSDSFILNKESVNENESFSLSKLYKRSIKKNLAFGVNDLIQKPIIGSFINVRINFLANFNKTAKTTIISQKSISEDISIKRFKIPIWKRIFDILFVSFALLMLSPLLISVIVLIKTSSKGPVFYSSKRFGGGRIFDFYKFRSMRVGADTVKTNELKAMSQYKDAELISLDKDFVASCRKCADLGYPCSSILYIHGIKICENEYSAIKKSQQKNAFIKIKDDPRITRIGKFIRKYSVDELPQLINILKGDMSIVGNRPIPLNEAESITRDNLVVGPAGLTGLWQVSRRGSDDMSSEERIALDNEYAKTFSFWFDIKLILKTFGAFIQKEDV